MKKIISLLLALSMSMTAFVACGNDEEKSGEDTPAVKVVEIALTEEEYAFGVAKDDPELLAAVNDFIAEIKEDGTFDEILDKYFGDGTPEAVVPVAEDSSKDQLVVVTNAEFAPFEYMEGDKYYGVDMEIAAALAESLGKELVIKNVDFESVCSNIDAGYGDIAMAGLTVNEERTAFVTFSDSYYGASQYVVVKGDDKAFDDCKTADEVITILNKMKESDYIGVQTGTTGQLFVDGDADWGFDGLTPASKGYGSGALAVQDMLNGGVKYVIIDAAPAICIAEAINKVN